MTTPRGGVRSTLNMDAKELGHTAHIIPQEEKTRFVDYINQLLKDDLDLQGILPVNPDSMEFFEAVKSGLLLSKLVNAVAPSTIDMKKIHKGPRLTRFNVVENHNTVLAGAKKIGVNLVNIGVVDLEEGKPHLVLGLVWQVIKAGLVNGMATRVDQEDRAKLKQNPQEVLMNWFNDQLKAAGSTRQVKNLTTDISDSECYTILLNHLSPANCSKKPLDEKDPLKRAELFLEEADKLGLRKFVTAKDIVEGQSKLNFAFLANIFSNLSSIPKGALKVPEKAPAPAPAAAKKSVDPTPKPPVSQAEHLETTIARLRKENEELRARLAEQEAKSSAQTRALNDQKIENDQLKEKMKQFEQAMANSAQQKDLQRKIEQHSREREDLLKRIKELEEQLAALRKTHAQVQEENARYRADLEQAEAEIQRLDSNVLRLEGELDDKDENIRDLLRQIAELKDRLDKAEGRLKEYVYEERVRVETLKNDQMQNLKVPLKDARVGSRFSGWLHIKKKDQWNQRYFVIKDNHLFYYRSAKDSDSQCKLIPLILGSKVEEHSELEIAPAKPEVKGDERKRMKIEAKRKKKVEKERKKEEERKKRAEAKGEVYKAKPVKGVQKKHNVIVLELPPTGDIVRRKQRYYFVCESQSEMNTWAAKLREALTSLPDANAVYYYVVPEAKRAAEAEKNRKAIPEPAHKKRTETHAGSRISFSPGSPHLNAAGSASPSPMSPGSREVPTIPPKPLTNSVVSPRQQQASSPNVAKRRDDESSSSSSSSSSSDSSTSSSSSSSLTD